MALLDFQQQILGRNKLWGATVGASDLPTTAGNGDWTVGDIVLNLSATIGAPAMWQCSAVSSSTYAPTFSIIATGVSVNQSRSVAGSTTLLSTDSYLFITAAGTITLPAPSTTLGTHSYKIKVTAQPVTITPASGNLDGVTSAITLSTEDSLELFTDSTNWFTIGNYHLANGPVRAITAPGTIFQTDRWINSGAGQLTISPTAGWAIGQPVGVVASASSVTITPGSGNINGAAALTLASAGRAAIVWDGTNYWSF